MESEFVAMLHHFQDPLKQYVAHNDDWCGDNQTPITCN